MIQLIIYALGGMVFTLIMDVYRSGIDINAFRFSKWWNENGRSLLFGLVVVLAGVVVPESADMMEHTNSTAFVLGCGFQALLAVQSSRGRKKK